MDGIWIRIPSSQIEVDQHYIYIAHFRDIKHEKNTLNHFQISHENSLVSALRNPFNSYIFFKHPTSEQMQLFWFLKPIISLSAGQLFEL